MELSSRTKFYTQEHVEQKWFIVDATGKTLGRIASKIAHVIRGKHKPTFTTNADIGDFVVVINAEKVVVTGKRQELKQYYHNTQYPGGARFESIQDIIKTKPHIMLEHAVKGMLPHNRLGRRMHRKLKVYVGPDHPHSAQQPEILPL